MYPSSHLQANSPTWRDLRLHFDHFIANQGWDFVATLRLNRRTSYDPANTLFGRFLGRLDSKLLGSRWSSMPAYLRTLAIAIPHDLGRDGTHLHVLGRLGGFSHRRRPGPITLENLFNECWKAEAPQGSTWFRPSKEIQKYVPYMRRQFRTPADYASMMLSTQYLSDRARSYKHSPKDMDTLSVLPESSKVRQGIETHARIEQEYTKLLDLSHAERQRRNARRRDRYASGKYLLEIRAEEDKARSEIHPIYRLGSLFSE